MMKKAAGSQCHEKMKAGWWLWHKTKMAAGGGMMSKMKAGGG
jgi:hypothetical protein